MHQMMVIFVVLFKISHLQVLLICQLLSSCVISGQLKKKDSLVSVFLAFLFIIQ